MKKLILAIGVPLFFFLFTPQTEAQTVRRHRARVVVGKPTVKIVGQRVRTRRRIRRRTYRRINRRTLRTLPAGARAVSYKSTRYYPVNGFYYIKGNNTYLGVLPPVGFRVATIPWAYTNLVVSGRTYYYAHGLYYSRVKDEYELTEPPVGAKIAELPEGHEEVNIGEKQYYAFEDSLYSSSDEGYELVGFLEDESK